MTARFRVVHFVPDPFSGGRVPIAALVDVGGRVEVAYAESRWEKFLPANARLVARLVRKALAEGVGFDALPSSSGPHALLGEIRPIPKDVEQPVDWVRQAIFGVTEEATVQVLKLERRQSVGQRLLKEWHVAQWVKRGYRPTEAETKYAHLLPEISHYVQGKSGLMLMEPVIAAQPQFESQIQHVGTAFLAWQHSLEDARLSRRPEFYAYVVSNGHRDSVEEARNAFRGLAKTVDVGASAEREEFLAKIKMVGQSLYLN